MLKPNFRLKHLHVALIVLVFGLGIAIRLYDLTDPPMDFHPARQYHSAVIARGLYTEWGGEYPEWQAQQHRAQGSSEARIEPPIFEHLVAFTYLLSGSDALWIARLYAILFWVGGAIPLYLLAKRLQGFEAGLVASGVFLLLPYGVIASRSFQPDPLMVACSIFALWSLYRWGETPSWKYALGTGLWMGAAILVKQVAVFFLLAAFLGLLWAKWGKRLLVNPQAWVIGGLALLPALAYNFYGVFISGALAGQYSGRFYPGLWLDPGFYIRWTSMIQGTTGIALFLVAFIGLLLIQGKAARGMTLGFMAGYLAYGFMFAHHISTHDYYQLPALPLVALGLGTAAAVLFAQIRKINGDCWGSTGIALVLLAGAAWSLWEARASLKAENYREDPELLVQLVEEMGGSRTATIGLMEDYGAALYYYAYNLPAYWWSEQDGIALKDMGQQELEDTIRQRLAGRAYFIVTDFNAFNGQPALRDYLETHYNLLYDSERYRIYNLQDG